MTVVDQHLAWSPSTLLALLGGKASTYLEIGPAVPSATLPTSLRDAGLRSWSIDGSDAGDGAAALVTRESLPDLLDRAGVPDSVDLLLVTAGFNDFHLLEAFLAGRRARLVVVPLNPALGTTADLVVPYLPTASREDGSTWYGASLAAYEALAAARGFLPVRTDAAGTSLILVAQEEAAGVDPELLGTSRSETRAPSPVLGEEVSEPFLTSEHYLVQGVASVQTRWGRVSYFLRDEYIGPAFTRGGYWEADTIRTVVAELEPHRGLVLDVGAHVGTHTLGIAAQRPDLDFVCFEPQHGLRLLLERNVAENRLSDRVRVLPYALVDAPRKVRLSATFSDGEGAGKQIEYDGSVVGNFGGVQIGDDGEDVEAVSIDSLLADSDSPATGVAYIKIDVEGAERLVFSGARRTIEEGRPIIMFEDREDRRLPDRVLDDLGVPQSARSFDVLGFLGGLDYDLRPLGLDYLALPR